jgi:hypothetical protein
MRNPAWTDKDLSCALGSWAELRHDTILYAKQSMTLGGGWGGTYRDAFVEANPWAFARLAALTRLMIDGLSDLGLLLDDFGGRLQDLEQLLLSLKGIAEKELTNQSLTIPEHRLVRWIGKQLASLIIFKFSFDCDVILDDDMAVIADVHSDFATGNCLEVGVGRPLTIYVINKSGNQLVIAMGSAYSYYEFSQPLNNRLTDEAWKEMLSGSSPPSLPQWMGSYADLSAPFNLGDSGNAYDPRGRTWLQLTITAKPISSPPANRYTVHVTTGFRCGYTSLTLEAVCGGYRQTISLPMQSSAANSTEYEGILNLSRWPSGVVTLAAYVPTDVDVFKTTTFNHTALTAIPSRLWQLYY